ncbi:hypothetical protein ACFO4O_12095 [Glaciecola siphonariae]|uniref:Uncharacterized protein n=1 Tax=Glaciecola siphonariae TaxID=521012 RepID=A0ABV9LYL3_9ALTE
MAVLYSAGITMLLLGPYVNAEPAQSTELVSTDVPVSTDALVSKESVTQVAQDEPQPPWLTDDETAPPAPRTNSATFESRYRYCTEKAWLDDAYCYLNYGVDSTANTINSWFLHSRSDPSVATTSGRLRFGWEPRSGDLSEFDLRFRIRAKLPGLKDRVELLLSDEEDNINQQDIKAAQNSDLSANDRAVVALQFKKNKEDHLSYRIGFGRGSQLYTRARYNNEISISDATKFYYYAEANYYSGDKFGFEVDGVVSTQISPNTAFELTNSFQYRDNREDWYWRHEARYLVLGKNDTSYLFTAMIDGLSRPVYRKESMLVSARYKRRILREWLYLEIEPFIVWLREEDFRTSFGIALRAEVHFST